MNKKDITIILDPAHGEETPGKRSPDGKFREFSWSRDVIALLVGELDERGYSIASSNASRSEIGLSKRAAVANAVKSKAKVFISIHSNAAGDGATWMNARGYSVYTTKGKTNSDILAEYIMKQFTVDFPELKKRADMSDGDMDTEENFTVISKTNCPAVLIEWLFQDNKDDVKLLMDNEYNVRLSKSIADAIDNLYESKLIW